MVINPLVKEKAAGQTLKSYRVHAAGLDEGAAEVHACPEDVWGGEIIPLSERQRARWIERHPLGGNVKNSSTFASGSGSVSASGSGSASEDSSVQTFQNGAKRAIFGRENSLMAVTVFIGARVFGLGM